MHLFVDFSDSRPAYQQLRDQIVEAIADKALAEGDRLPTTRQLAADLAINFHTVARAYDLLRQEGFIQAVRKTGTAVRVTGGPSPAWRRALRTVLAEAAAKGMPQDQVLAACADILQNFGETSLSEGSFA